MDYGELAEFVLVYIREAHAADGPSPMPITNEKPVNTPKTHEDRCEIAERFLKRKPLKYTCVVDDIQDSVEKAYDAFPDRVYVIGVDGKVAVQGAPGPFGFQDSVKRVKGWLRDYRKAQQAAENKE